MHQAEWSFERCVLMFHYIVFSVFCFLCIGVWNFKRILIASLQFPAYAHLSICSLTQMLFCCSVHIEYDYASANLDGMFVGYMIIFALFLWPFFSPLKFFFLLFLNKRNFICFALSLLFFLHLGWINTVIWIGIVFVRASRKCCMNQAHPLFYL